MNEDLVKKVRAAAGATWWVVLIGAIWMTVGYLIWLAFMHGRPAWLLDLYGGAELDWCGFQIVVLFFFGLLKLGLFALVGAAIWLTLFARRLRRPG